MPKFSIIVPVYNLEKYIKRCLDSIFKQSFKDFEVIVVNDGSSDKSLDIIKEYDVVLIDQKNKGVSESRNNAIKKAKGDYIVFVDGDDTIDKELLEKLDKASNDNPDIIRFQSRETFDNKEAINHEEEGFNTCSGVEAFEKICNYHYVETVALYCIKREYFEKEKFEFAKNMLHEDFRLIPLVIIKASKVKSISYIGYNYYQRENSIMNAKEYEKTKRKVKDFFNHYKHLISEIDKTNLDSRIFKSYISNSLIEKITELNNEDYQEYKNYLKEENVYDNLLTDTFARRIKKIIVKISPKLYYKIK